jgi:hypothetical protein
MIEGTQSSLQDLLAAEAHVLSADRPSDVSEVVNYVRAMNYGLTRLSELPVSVRLIREIHGELMVIPLPPSFIPPSAWPAPRSSARFPGREADSSPDPRPRNLCPRG